jgi:hypothetical protein
MATAKKAARCPHPHVCRLPRAPWSLNAERGIQWFTTRAWLQNVAGLRERDAFSPSPLASYSMDPTLTATLPTISLESIGDIKFFDSL